MQPLIAVQRGGGDALGFTEGRIGVIGAAGGPMVVGSVIEVFAVMLPQLCEGVYGLDGGGGEAGVHIIDGLLAVRGAVFGGGVLGERDLIVQGGDQGIDLCLALDLGGKFIDQGYIGLGILLAEGIELVGGVAVDIKALQLLSLAVVGGGEFDLGIGVDGCDGLIGDVVTLLARDDLLVSDAVTCLQGAVGADHALAQRVGIGIPQADLACKLARKEAGEREFREFGEASFLVLGVGGAEKEEQTDEEADGHDGDEKQDLKPVGGFVEFIVHLNFVLLQLKLEVHKGIVAVTRQREGGQQQQQYGDDHADGLEGAGGDSRLGRKLLNGGNDRGAGHRCDGEEEDVILQKHGGIGVAEGHAVGIEDAEEGFAEACHVAEFEDQEADEDHGKGTDRPQDADGQDGILLGLDHILFQHQEEEEIEPPKDEVPVGAVPNAGQGPNGEHIEDMAGNRDAVAPQGDINIVTEEGGQRDVPSSPKIGDRVGYVGVVEVFLIMEAHHKPHADGHIGVGGEIQINLEHVAEAAQ